MGQDTSAFWGNARYSPILELRQYATYPGKRDVLIALFEKFFIEKHEELGAELVGLFRELNHPDLYVWLRGFPDMETRRKMLEGFYSSQIWMAHREEANSTMVDSDNVLLLREAWPGSGFHVGPRNSDAMEITPKASIVTATVCYFDTRPTEYFISLFENVLTPVLTKAGGPPIATFVTEYSANNFPRLPVRGGENVFVWFARFDNQESYHEYRENLTGEGDWYYLLTRSKVSLSRSPEVIELLPTLRSKLW